MATKNFENKREQKIKNQERVMNWRKTYQQQILFIHLS